MNKLAILLAGTAILSQTSLAEIKKDVKFTEEPHGVCSTLMTVEVKEGKIESFKAARGCPGNLNAISKLLPGMEVTKVIELLDDNECSGAQMPGVTSCMDNMVEMLKYHVMGEGEGHVTEIRNKLMKQKGVVTILNAGHVCSGCGLCQAKLG